MSSSGRVSASRESVTVAKVERVGRDKLGKKEESRLSQKMMPTVVRKVLPLTAYGKVRTS